MDDAAIGPRGEEDGNERGEKMHDGLADRRSQLSRPCPDASLPALAREVQGAAMWESRMPADLVDLSPRRVCLIKPSSLGDVVHALPVLSALREAWPKAHIAWVINKGLRGLLDGHPHLDEVIPFDRSSVGFSPRGISTFASFLKGLRVRRFDLAIDLQGLFRSGLMTAATGAGFRVGLADAREGAGRFYSHRVSTGPQPIHAVDKMMRVVSAFGIEAATQFLATISPEDHAWASRSLIACSGPRLVVNVGARWLTKRWPPSRFAEVARRAVQEKGVSLVAVGAREDHSLVDELITGLGDVPILDLSGRTTLPQLAAVMAASDCVVSNDTGPLHLAAATGVRVVGVFTCTSPEKTGPYGPHALSVASKVWCAGSCVKTCSRMECMGELTPDRVYEAVLRQLDDVGRRKATA